MNGTEERSLRTAEESRVRPWPVTALGVILLSQSVLMTLIAVAELNAAGLGWLRPIAGEISLSIDVGLIFLAPLALIAAIGFFKLWSRAWVIGMGLQGLSLTVALAFYFYSDVSPAYVYGGMAYHIFTVMYLNSHAVKTIFRVEGYDEF